MSSGFNHGEKSKKRYPNLAGDLAVLSVVRGQIAPKTPMSHGDIAEVVGCSRMLIYEIEKTALRKLEVKLRNKGIGANG